MIEKAQLKFQNMFPTILLEALIVYAIEVSFPLLDALV